MADRDQLMRDIRFGARLRPTNTVDKSKPIILGEGESLKPIASHQNGSSPNPITTGPPAPPPPPLSSSSNGPSAGLRRQYSKTNLLKNFENEAGQSKNQNGLATDRDALMVAIRQGVSLRRVQNGTADSKKPENHAAQSAHRSDQSEKSIAQKVTKTASVPSSGGEASTMKKVAEQSQIRPSLIKQNSAILNGKSRDGSELPSPTTKSKVFPPLTIRHDSGSKSVISSENGNGTRDIGHVTKLSPRQETAAAPTMERRRSIQDTVANFEKRISPEASDSAKRFVPDCGTSSSEKRSVTNTVKNFEKKQSISERGNIAQTVSNFEKRISSEFSSSENRLVSDSYPNSDVRLRPQKLPLSSARSSSSSSGNRTPETIKTGPDIRTVPIRSDDRNIDFIKNGSDQKTDFALGGFVNGAKAMWEKRKSVDDLISPQNQSISKPNTGSTLRIFNRPDYPESVAVTAPSPSSFSTTTCITPVPQTMPIAIDTNFHHSSIDLSLKKSNSVHCLQHKDTLPKVDNIRRAYEKSDSHSMDQVAIDQSTLRRQCQKSTNTIQRNHHNSESLASGDRPEWPLAASQKSSAHAKVTRQSARFLPDVGALKQRFEEKAIEERGKSAKVPPSQQQQTTSTTSAASSGYSSGSPSPQSAENAPKSQPSQNGSSRLQYDRHRSRSGNFGDKSFQPVSQNKKSPIHDHQKRHLDDGAMKGSYVANNPNSETVGPFKASVGTLGGDGEGAIKKNRNYFRSAADSVKQNFDSDHRYLNGNANDTATWIVKKGNLPNIVSKYAVCEHLEALVQRRISSSAGGSVAGTSTDSAENSKSTKSNGDDLLLDGEVARLLGVPFEKLKELRFDIDVNDPEGSLLRIQKRYNEVS